MPPNLELLTWEEYVFIFILEEVYLELFLFFPFWLH